MELRHLRYFVVAAEEQNVTRAAERLHLSQPPLSRQIRDLEHELGVELFRRSARSLALTDAGRAFLPEARAVLLRADEAMEAARAVAQQGRGQVRVGYAPSLTARFLPRALEDFAAARPGVQVALHDLSSEECRQRLAARKLDVALTIRPGDPTRGFRYQPIARARVACAVGPRHRLAGRRHLRLAELRDEPFVSYAEEDYPEYAARVRALCRAAGFRPRIVGEYDGATGLITAVESGRGVAVVAATLGCLAGPRIVLVPFRPQLAALEVGAIWPVGAGEAVTSFVRSAARAAGKVREEKPATNGQAATLGLVEGEK